MSDITRRELREIGTICLVANTPYSLFSGLSNSSVVKKLRDHHSYDQLVAQFEKLTARDKRSAICLGLAYATLIALNQHPNRNAIPDSSQLDWGQEIAALSQGQTGTTIIYGSVASARPAPGVQVLQETGNGGNRVTGIVLPRS